MVCSIDQNNTQFFNVAVNPSTLRSFSDAVQNFKWSDGVPNPPHANPDQCGNIPGEKVDGGVTSGIYYVAPAPNTTFGFNLTTTLPKDDNQYDLFL